MAKLLYNSDLVDSALFMLARAKGQLASTDAEISTAISQITSARGIEYVNTGGVCSAAGMGKQCQELIETSITGINNRVEMIKEYNADIDNMGVGTRFLSTIGFGVTKFAEGLLTAGENITDGFVSGIGFLAGVFGGKAGKEWRDTTVAEYVKKDHVGDAFGDLYKNQLSDMVKASYMKENGFGANFCKIVGTSVGYSLALAGVGAIGGGVGAIASGASSSNAVFAAARLGSRAALGSLKATMGMAFVGGLGSGTQYGLQSGMQYNEAVWKGAKIGAFQAGCVLAVHGLMKLGKSIFGKNGTTASGGSSSPAGDGTTGGSGPSSGGSGPTSGGSSGTTGGTSGTTGGTSGSTGGTSGTTGGTAGGAAGGATSSGGTFKLNPENIDDFAAMAGRAAETGQRTIQDILDDVASGKLTERAAMRQIAKAIHPDVAGASTNELFAEAVNDLKNVVAGNPLKYNWAHVSGTPASAAAAAGAAGGAAASGGTPAGGTSAAGGATGGAPTGGTPTGSTPAAGEAAGSAASGSTFSAGPTAGGETSIISRTGDIVDDTLDDALRLGTDTIPEGQRLITPEGPATSGGGGAPTTLVTKAGDVVDDTLDDAITSSTRTSNQSFGDYQRMSTRYEQLVENRAEAVARYGEGSKQVARIDKAMEEQIGKMQAKLNESSAALARELETDPAKLIRTNVGTEGNMKLIQGDMVVGSESVPGDVTTLGVQSGGDVRPAWTDATAMAEGQIDGSALRKLPAEPVPTVPPTFAPTFAPTQPALPPHPTVPELPPGPTYQALPPHPTQPALPAHPTVPELPAGPTQPALPAHPTVPELPAGPTQPALPPHPTQPALPPGPTQPSLPPHPTQPALPPGPTQQRVLPTVPPVVPTPTPTLPPVLPTPTPTAIIPIPLPTPTPTPIIPTTIIPTDPIPTYPDPTYPIPTYPDPTYPTPTYPDPTYPVPPAPVPTTPVPTTPVPTTPVPTTPVPTTPVPTTPVPTEYIPPIPYTGVGYDKPMPDYIKNIAIGAGLGAAAGIAGVALHKRHEDDDEEKE